MSVTEQPRLRDLKRARTRLAIVEAGARLFAERGYDQTTVADIAAAAEIGKRTFFDYFDSKEQLLFPGGDARAEAALNAIANRDAHEEPVDVLLRALDDVSRNADLSDSLTQLRLRLAREVPAVQSRALRLQVELQQRITAELNDAYPAIDELAIAALVGAFIGAISAAVPKLSPKDSSVARARVLRRAVMAALGRA